jgi:hypothetical protein
VICNLFVGGKVIKSKFIKKTEDEIALDKMNLMEHDEQAEFVSWCYRQPINQLHLLFSVPNGGRRTIGVAKKMKMEGQKAGVPDLFLPVARAGYHGLFIEMKRRRGGSLSIEQKELITLLGDQGYCCVVCCGYHEAIRSTISYLMAS